MEHTKVVVKQISEKVDKKKTFNYESVIEITLPSAPIPAQPPVLDVPREKASIEEKLEEPIKPIICTPLKPKIPSHNNNNMSPESFVSNKQNPMEWDSFIPVSYSPFVAINSLPPYKCILFIVAFHF